MQMKIFPMKMPDGRVVINERCQCGHLRTQHRGIVAHGTCEEVRACGCEKYSFAEWILLDVTE
jgi:hypothetical protein